MTNQQNILICSAGRRVALVRFFQEQIKKFSIPSGKVFATDLDPTFSAACQVSDHAIKVGLFSDPDYIEVLLKHCIYNDIGLVIPTIDTELSLLARYKTEFANNGIDVIVSDASLVKICRDKRLTNFFFENNGFLVPKAIDKTNLTYPFFVKPVDGSNSKSLYLIEHPDMLFPQLLQRDDLMFMEYLPKKNYTEYTVDMYYNRQHELCCIVPRIRLEIRGGEVNKSITRKNHLIPFLRERLHSLPGAIGCLTLQCFVSNENPTVIYGIEINPRFGGGFPLSYLAGANYPGMLIEEYFFQKTINYTDDWQDNTLLLRYDADMTIHYADFKS
jgi:carbamoyl-phosphate synthase large subunit